MPTQQLMNALGSYHGFEQGCSRRTLRRRGRSLGINRSAWKASRLLCDMNAKRRHLLFDPEGHFEVLGDFPAMRRKRSRGV